jgi:hypothetical protein
LKFSDVVLATVSILLITWSLYFILAVAFVPLKPNTTGDTLADIISLLVGSLIVGYVFAPKIQEESKIKAIGGIAVLSTFVFMVLIMIWFASPQASPWFKDSLNSMFNTNVNTNGWTDYQVAVYSGLLQTMETVVGLVVFFIGLYAGSMLRKPSAKTKE